MRASVIVSIVLIAIVGLAGAWLFVLRDHATASQLPRYGQRPDFRFVDQAGSEVAGSLIDGKVTVINFFFTSCQGICPRLNGAVQQVVAETKSLPDVRFVSVTVDPEHDTVEVLREYAEKFRADSGRWSFVTGDEAQIRDFLVGLKLGFADKPVEHTTRIALVDRDGQIRGYYQGLDEQAIEFLIRDIKRIA